MSTTRTTSRTDGNSSSLHKMPSAGASSRKRSSILPHTKEAGDAYAIGDIYDRLRATRYGQYGGEKNHCSSSCETLGPYSAQIRELSRQWPYMQYLADFMTTTCAPTKKYLLDEMDRAERAVRQKVALLEFSEKESVRRTNFESIKMLEESLQDSSKIENPTFHRLFVVEDLSRDVIETLGHCLGIDPQFFRAHISDYVWYNIRDPWVELPDLEAFSSQRDHFSVRYVQPRYFMSEESFRLAQEEAGAFNVLRRVDRSHDHVAGPDKPGSIVGMVRTKVSLWIRPKSDNSEGVVGVILLDPPIHEGYPLWGSYSDFTSPLSSKISPETQLSPRPPYSPFEDFIYWTTALTSTERHLISFDPRIFALKALHSTIANRYLYLEYAKTRITQIGWEIEDPSFKLIEAREGLDGCLRRLHRWRRVLPLFQGSVEELLRNFVNRPHKDYPIPITSTSTTTNPITALRPDLENQLDQIASLQRQCAEIQNLVTALISIEDNRKTYDQNIILIRLTYLACIFLPMSFLASVFSMSNDLQGLGHTIWVYFAIALPLTGVCLGVPLLLYSSWWSARGGRLGIIGKGT